MRFPGLCQSGWMSVGDLERALAGAAAQAVVAQSAAVADLAAERMSALSHASLTRFFPADFGALGSLEANVPLTFHQPGWWEQFSAWCARRIRRQPRASAHPRLRIAPRTHATHTLTVIAQPTATRCRIETRLHPPLPGALRALRIKIG